MESQTESRKNQGMIFSRSKLARKTEPNLKLYGEALKVYPQVKFLGITCDSQLTFKTLWGHPGPLQHQVPQIKAAS